MFVVKFEGKKQNLDQMYQKLNFAVSKPINCIEITKYFLSSISYSCEGIQPHLWTPGLSTASGWYSLHL